MNEQHKVFYYKGREYHCTLELAMDVIGGKWKSMLIFHLRGGPLRSSTLQHCLRGISNKMFTQSVRELEADGLLRREIFPVIPPKVEYSLTARGKSLLPIVISLAQWGMGLCDPAEDQNQAQCRAELEAAAQEQEKA